MPLRCFEIFASRPSGLAQQENVQHRQMLDVYSLPAYGLWLVNLHGIVVGVHQNASSSTEARPDRPDETM